MCVCSSTTTLINRNMHILPYTTVLNIHAPVSVCNLDLLNIRGFTDI